MAKVRDLGINVIPVHKMGACDDTSHVCDPSLGCPQPSKPCAATPQCAEASKKKAAGRGFGVLDDQAVLQLRQQIQTLAFTQL